MENRKKRSLAYYMRMLHRDIGFFMIGFVCIYCLSGIVLVYRDTDFLKTEREIEKQLPPDIQESKLGMMLRLKNFQLEKTENGIVYFNLGQYNQETGIAKYTSKELPGWMNKLVGLHKITSGSPVHWVAVVFGVLLLFLAISSFWMIKSGTKVFRRSMIYVAVGVTAMLLVIVLM
ncbi:hypothetical protein SAMN05444274_102502 [Mariniphaga anaerophila]|uniref:PepSY-associated TM region n=1 Tax=Mariniphaga anaerophila TaxID=1484053 RepID=A0A1M4WNV8_9BACT|nr:hypothetical protein [Mariniphaga anaerophila]SHE82733.1 hypothetical protein SAMN05444274_102502 [Mariniphaga anaerophila]